MSEGQSLDGEGESSLSSLLFAFFFSSLLFRIDSLIAEGCDVNASRMNSAGVILNTCSQ